MAKICDFPYPIYEKVASFFFKKKHTQFKTRVQKPYPIYDQNGQNRNPIMTKTAAWEYPSGIIQETMIIVSCIIPLNF